MKKERLKPTLDRPANYQIRVPGHLDQSWARWVGEVKVTVDCDYDGQPVTILACNVDQAALHGLLRRLYSMGIPLISVTCVGFS